MKNKFISVILPCYNEEGNIQLIYTRLSSVLKNYNYEIIFINDGSKDDTLKKLKSLSVKDKHVKYISFSRNFGHQNALRAGYKYATGDCVICLDADLQHPPEIIPNMIEHWEQGYDIVYSIRKDTKNTGFFKRITATIFYKFINFLIEIKIPHGSADFRLLDKKIVTILNNQIHENDLFFRGIFPWMGFKQIAVKYIPNKRFAGETKYGFIQMLNFAITGITSFSIKPLRIAILLGGTTILFAFIYLLYILGLSIFTDKALQGWSSLIVTVLIMGGANMFILGIIGEYIGKLVTQTKNRPEYLINETNIN